MTRIDVWLWSVRIFKTRSMATQAVKGGHVRHNDEPAKPSQQVKVGDVVTLRQPGWDRSFEVLQLLDKRVGAKVAVTAYRDLSPQRPAWLSMPVARRAPGTGRPTKKQRRETDRLRGR
ncbi:ribosome-associated heat shock protein Hsp15 [Propionibacterium cyclohexanicum]|uniref:Ribosome-associated heat shock protein Hsp15 n=1 Tax=Propionibacterium cyclohexanicum TaxID=64702 RepID=A0A1H9TC87_9ACTN|nr:RNA-binding S4 domain-containing protein [Propionibacterium cyclohexanicum]SER94832.1 ribosome-associated heat shock protein Hsp15 [Propionibacterium cyclohexanicum]